MTGPVRVGVVGAGVISRHYLEHLRRAADVDVVMVADLDLARAEARADEFGVPAAGGLAELLERDDVELVVNLTIPAAHADVGLAALASGKHLYNEKPLASELADARRLLDAAEPAGLRVACAPDTVLGAGLQTGRRLIDDGVIGEPRSAVTVFEARGPERWHPNPEFLYARGGGPVLDMGPYYLSVLTHTLGPVARVTATGSRALDERVIGSGPRAGTTLPVEVLTHVVARLDFAGGATAQSTFSFESAGDASAVVDIVGTAGIAHLPDPNTFDGDVRIRRDGSRRPEIRPADGSTMGRGHGVVELARAIRAGRAERCAGTTALHVLEILSAIIESAETNRPIDVVSRMVPPPVLPAEWDPYAATL